MPKSKSMKRLKSWASAFKGGKIKIPSKDKNIATAMSRTQLEDFPKSSKMKKWESFVGDSGLLDFSSKISYNENGIEFRYQYTEENPDNGNKLHFGELSIHGEEFWGCIEIKDQNDWRPHFDEMEYDPMEFESELSKIVKSIIKDKL